MKKTKKTDRSLCRLKQVVMNRTNQTPNHKKEEKQHVPASHSLFCSVSHHTTTQESTHSIFLFLFFCVSCAFFNLRALPPKFKKQKKQKKNRKTKLQRFNVFQLFLCTPHDEEEDALLPHTLPNLLIRPSSFPPQPFPPPHTPLQT